MTSDGKVLSFEEVSKHNRKTDCWLIISGKVYAVFPFLDDHPGGDEVRLLATGKIVNALLNLDSLQFKEDATEDFLDVGHGQTARDMMKDFYVGEVDSNCMPRDNKYDSPSAATYSSYQASGSSSSTKMMLLAFIMPILILLLAYALY